MSELATVTQNQEMIQALKDNIQMIQSVYNEVLKKDEHYGTIPGTNKPTLYKAGAEKIVVLLGLEPHFDPTRNDLPNDHLEYMVKCTLTKDGNHKGEGLGSCSTRESKYRYRYAERYCPDCGQSTIRTDRQGHQYYCWKKLGGCGRTYPFGSKAIEEQPLKEDNPDIADQYNTVLKMAKKRAYVDAVLTIAGVSDIFTQDLEETQNGNSKPKSDPPKTTPEPAKQQTNGKKESINDIVKSDIKEMIGKVVSDTEYKDIQEALIKIVTDNKTTIGELRESDYDSYVAAVTTVLADVIGNA